MYECMCVHKRIINNAINRDGTPICCCLVKASERNAQVAPQVCALNVTAYASRV